MEASLDSQPLDLIDYPWAEEGLLVLSYAGVPQSGFTLSLTTRADQEIRIELEDSSLGLPPELADRTPPRPDDTMPSPLYRRDATEVRASYVF